MTEVFVEEHVEIGDFARNEVIAWRYNENALISDIRPSSFNPRKMFDAGYIAELAVSIAQNGVLQPIALRHIAGDNEGLYEIICGECRYRAAKIAGLAVIPARIARNMGDKQALQIAIIENLQRKDVNPIEEAQGFQALREMGFQVQEIAEQIGCVQSTISNSMRLLELPAYVQDAVSAGLVSKSHARALVPFAELPGLLGALVTGISKGLTSKGIETFDLNKMPNEIRGDLYKLTTELGGYNCKFSPDEICMGCAKRMRRYCLDKDCFEAQNAAAIADAEAKEAAEMAAGNLINLRDYDNVEYRMLDSRDIDCEADCEHIRQAKTCGYIRTICLNPECCDQKCKAKIDLANAERQARIDEVIARSLDVVYHDPNVAHKLRVIAVYKTVASQSKSFVVHLEAAAARLGQAIDFSAIRACIDNVYMSEPAAAMLNALYEIPEDYLCLLVAEAVLRHEAAGYREKLFNDWLCGSGEGEGIVESDSEPVCQADCASCGTPICNERREKLKDPLAQDSEAREDSE